MALLQDGFRHLYWKLSSDARTLADFHTTMSVSAISGAAASYYDPSAIRSRQTGSSGNGENTGSTNTNTDATGKTNSSGTGRVSGTGTGSDPTDGRQGKPGELSQAEQAQVKDLQKRDREVRQHEMAHLAASGGLAMSGATYSYQVGPDGISYAVGGEVRIDVSPGRTPEETLARAQTIRAAALAPADPSGQDLAVASAATQMAAQARAEQATSRSEATEPGSTGASAEAGTGAGAEHRHPGVEMYQKVGGIADDTTGAVNAFA